MDEAEVDGLDRTSPSWSEKRPSERLGAACCSTRLGACLLAQGNVPAAIEGLRAVRDLVREQPEDFTIGWTFGGTLHFVRHTPDLPNREALEALFQAFDAPDRDAIVEGLEAVVEELE